MTHDTRAGAGVCVCVGKNRPGISTGFLGGFQKKTRPGGGWEETLNLN